MTKFRHLSHPVISAGVLWNIIRSSFYRFISNRQLRKIQRVSTNNCWCGGTLNPFKWHSSYGICSECGCYVNKRPPRREEFSRIYSSRLYWGSIAKMRGWPTLEHRADLYSADGRLRHWLDLIAKYCPQRGTAIEVGCAPGVLLAELCKQGYSCVGVEVEEEVAAWMRTHFHLAIRTGPFPDTRMDLPRCDLFLAFDVLEHVPSPLEFLNAAATLLNPSGIAILQTPVDRYDYDPPLGKEVPVVFDDTEHLFVFVDRSIQELAQRAGLQIVSLAEPPWRIGHELSILRKPDA